MRYARLKHASLPARTKHQYHFFSLCGAIAVLAVLPARPLAALEPIVLAPRMEGRQMTMVLRPKSGLLLKKAADEAAAAAAVPARWTSTAPSEKTPSLIIAASH